jgi:hypothetical protein
LEIAVVQEDARCRPRSEAKTTAVAARSSTVTAMKPDELIEWRHPVGHNWRWEFAAITPTITRVTETFDCRELVSPSAMPSASKPR